MHTFSIVTRDAVGVVSVVIDSQAINALKSKCLRMATLRTTHMARDGNANEDIEKKEMRAPR